MYILAPDKPFSFAGSGTQLFRNVKTSGDDDGNEDDVSPVCTKSYCTCNIAKSNV